MNIMLRPPISATNIVLLNYAKANRDPITISTMGRVLSPLYTSGMTLSDIIQVLMTAYFDLVQTKEFEIPYSGNLAKIMQNLMLLPIQPKFDGTVPVRGTSTITYEDLYTKWIRFIMKDYVIARVDWCADQLDIPKPTI